jgi:hypothetical protein
VPFELGSPDTESAGVLVLPFVTMEVSPLALPAPVSIFFDSPLPPHDASVAIANIIIKNMPDLLMAFYLNNSAAKAFV